MGKKSTTTTGKAPVTRSKKAHVTVNEETGQQAKQRASSLMKRMKALPPRGVKLIWIQYYEVEAKDKDSDYGKGFNRPPNYYERLMESYVSSEDNFFQAWALPSTPTCYRGLQSGSRIFRYTTVAGRSLLLRCAGFANRRIFGDAKVESAFENQDRTWRRWKGFCRHIGASDHFLLHHVPSDERELLLRAFLSAIRTSSWTVAGDIAAPRAKLVAGKTVSSAASHLASAFRRRLEWSPLHLANSTDLRPTLRDLLRAFDNVDPPVNRQKASTPRFLRAVYKNGRRDRKNRLLHRHASDLIIAAYFFACRSCEYTVTPSPGVTRRLMLRNITFLDADGVIIPHTHPDLRIRAVMVTVCFENQKNRHQMERRTHRITGNRALCPVLRFIDIVQRIHRHVPDVTPTTSLCTIIDDNLRPISIDNAFTLRYIRSTCLDFSTTSFGFQPMEIGNKSLRSGAAMAMFMARHSPDRIMLMGRWLSLTFLDYLRPQVLEWTESLSADMIKFEHFFDSYRHPLHDVNNGPSSVDTSNVVINEFNVDFDTSPKKQWRGIVT